MSPDPFPGFNTSISPCKPKSVGHLGITSPDWRTAPAIHPNYLVRPVRYRSKCWPAPLSAAAGRDAQPRRRRSTSELKPGRRRNRMTTGRGHQGAQLFRLPSGRHLPHGAGRCAAPWSIRRLRVHGMDRPAGGRCLDFPAHHRPATLMRPSIMVGERAAEIILGAPQTIAQGPGHCGDVVPVRARCQ